MIGKNLNKNLNKELCLTTSAYSVLRYGAVEWTVTYFSFFLSWYTTQMTPHSRAMIITNRTVGTSTAGSIPTPGELRADKEKIYCSSSIDCHMMYMWQSRVEIKDYSIAYFDCIAAFKAPYRWTSVKGKAHMHFGVIFDFYMRLSHMYMLQGIV